MNRFLSVLVVRFVGDGRPLYGSGVSYIQTRKIRDIKE